jgi:hypothetical protein
MTVEHESELTLSLDASVFIDQDGVMNTLSTALNMPLLTSARESYRNRRAARAAYARAERELATYTTPGEIRELSEMLQRSNSRDTTVYRDVVNNMRFRTA